MAIGSGWDGPADIIPDVEKFVCALYGRKYYAGINAVWCTLFRLICRSRVLPPNQHCLKHHIARVNYQIQIAIHHYCLERFIRSRSWMISGRWAAGVQMDGQFSSTQYVLKSINGARKCKKSGCKGPCSCLKWELPSTDVSTVCSRTLCKSAIS